MGSAEASCRGLVPCQPADRSQRKWGVLETQGWGRPIRISPPRQSRSLAVQPVPAHIEGQDTHYLLE